MNVPSRTLPKTCRQLRDRLLAGAAAPDAASAGAAAHLDGCAECQAFAGRLVATRSILSTRRAEVEPTPSFAPRVVAALPDTTELLGWAALRLLPAALALALGLTCFGLLQAPSPTALLNDPSADLLLTYAALAPSTSPGDPASPAP
jgi:hypothetical protein